MDALITRRHLLAVGVGGVASVAGCQSVLASEVSAVVHVLNAPEQSQDVYFELTRPDDESFQIGQILPIESGVAKSVELSVSPGSYEMMVNIDDVEPRPEKTVQWEITEDECSKVKYWTITPAETGLNLQLVEQSCEGSD